MQRIKHEVKHYVNGTKLLGYELKISTKLLIKFVQGYELSRRENNQLKRTMGDIFRLVPFSAFVIIPFAELLLPIALKIFPNLLPSTYESGKDKQKKRNKLIEIREKTSTFLHETLEESSLINYKSIENLENKKKFLNFFKKLYAYKEGKDPTIKFDHEEINSIAQLFKNDLILDNLSRPQLVAMSKFMSLRPFGNDNVLRYRIRYQLKTIMEDDKIIDYENVNTLSYEELYNACVSRGMKAYGVPRNNLVDNLKVWLELRLRKKIPSVLMVLSATFTFGGLENIEKIETVESIYNKTIATSPSKEVPNYEKLLDLYYDGILQVLGSIPDPVYNVTKLDVAESKPVKAEEESGIAQEPATPVMTSSKTETETTTSKPLPPAAIDATSSTQPQVVEGAAAETEAASEETRPTTDDNEFKLNVLKEQEELIKKEEEEAKARASREKISDDIKLDEEEAPPTSTSTPKEKNGQKQD